MNPRQMAGGYQPKTITIGVLLTAVVQSKVRFKNRFFHSLWNTGPMITDSNDDLIGYSLNINIGGCPINNRIANQVQEWPQVPDPVRTLLLRWITPQKDEP